MTHSDSGTVTTVSNVSSGEIVNIITNTANSVRIEDNNCVMVIDRDVCHVVDIVG